MYKYLVVGCGGSGGATLVHMMDQLRSELLPHGIERIPAGIQFVHIDVPVAADTKQQGIENVSLQGGTYIGTAPPAGSYPVLDNALTSRLGPSGALGEIATWAPRTPGRITGAISDGAGQLRAVGRAILLSRVGAVVDGLAAAVESLNTVEANAEMTALSRAVPGAGRFDPASGVVVLVISSMAGGAGASMALDVCRILANTEGIDPGRMGMFLATPDLFGSLSESARGGTNPNALAMFGEIVAAQTGAAQAHDTALLGAFGQRHDAEPRPPFARVFPVGSHVGKNRTLFGDGSTGAVYRGLGRGLAALMLSGQASSDFVTFDLANGNGNGLTPDRNLFGWGADPSALAWGAFGFGSLSLGRDRYRHYAAQRIARTAVDRLRTGHLQEGNSALGTEQLRVLLDSRWPAVAPAAGLPRQAAFGTLSKDEFSDWVTKVMMPRDEVEQDVRAQIDSLVRPHLPQPVGQAKQWLAPVRSFLGAQRAELDSATEQAALRWAHGWARRLHDSVVAEVEAGVAQFGLAYARGVVQRVESTIADQLIPQLDARSRANDPDPSTVPLEVESEVGRIKGVIANGQALVERLLQSTAAALNGRRYSRSCAIAVEVLRSFVADALRPLAASLEETVQLVEQATDTNGARTVTGLATVQTDRYPAWPSDQDTRVPDRFDVADNDVLITPAAEFAVQYEAHLRTAVAIGDQHPTFDDARSTAARYALSGHWPVATGRTAPGGLLKVVAEWRAPVFLMDPATGESIVPSRGRYVWSLRTRDVLDRALRFVSIPDGAFERYCGQSLVDYVAAADDPPARQGRIRDVADKFGQAVLRALPLISIDDDVVTALYGTRAEFFFKFSTIPFEDEPELVDALRRALGASGDVAPEVTSGPTSVFDSALSRDRSVNRIDVFGSYRNYAPVVFSGLLRSIGAQWESLPPAARELFWTHRRARPLAAALPMADQERRALVAGWYVGQLIGEIRIPEAPFTDPVRVWDDDARGWRDFPVTLLTPPMRFIGKSFDWLPAVLESVLAAWLRGFERPVMDSTRPYRLLRALYDATDYTPADGIFEVTAIARLADWLQTGRTRSGAPSRVEGATPAERLEAARRWLSTIHDFTAKEYLPPTPGAQGPAGEFATVSRRDQASVTPMFRDLAPDIKDVTERLLEVLEEAAHRDAAVQRTGSAAAPEPGFGSF